MRFEDGNAVDSRTRACPKCRQATVDLPLFTTRRRDPFTCPNCGTKLERVLPGLPYYSLAFVTAVLAEIAVLIGLILAIFQQWFWMAALIAGVVVINLGISAFLNSRTRVEFVDPADGREDIPGRWYPK